CRLLLLRSAFWLRGALWFGRALGRRRGHALRRLLLGYGALSWRAVVTNGCDGKCGGGRRGDGAGLCARRLDGLGKQGAEGGVSLCDPTRRPDDDLHFTVGAGGASIEDEKLTGVIGCEDDVVRQKDKATIPVLTAHHRRDV